jgi:hypothetical protein
MKLALFFCALLLLTGCSPSENVVTTWQNFEARDQGDPIERTALYRAKVPATWVRKDPKKDESISDNMKPISEFIIDKEVRLTIHTFPITDKRIPPQAQIARWKSQFNQLDPLMTTITPQSQSGFIGLLLEAEGQINGNEVSMMGWSMNLANEYEIKLRSSSSPHEQLKRADYTIKVVGPVQLVNKNKKSIVSFSKSFELIDELPAPL